MKHFRSTLLYYSVHLIYYIILLVYTMVLVPLLLKEYNIFYSFMYRQMFVTHVFLIFGLLLGLQNMLQHFIMSSPFTFCEIKIRRAIYLLLSYTFTCFFLLFFEVLQNHEGLHLIITGLSILVGYYVMNNFNLTKPEYNYLYYNIIKKREVY